MPPETINLNVLNGDEYAVLALTSNIGHDVSQEGIRRQEPAIIWESAITIRQKSRLVG